MANPAAPTPDRPLAPSLAPSLAAAPSFAPSPAPFHAAVAGGPAPEHCLWLTADDGVRLRAGYWTAGDRGTVLLLPGRSEYVEKYAGAAAELAARGYATVATDWRGQGLADRLLPDRDTGHVGRFMDYQRDLRAVLNSLPALGLEGPHYLLAHSMGGAIGLRALHQGLAVRAALFSAPMWGIAMPRGMRPLAWGLSYALRHLGLGARYTPGGGPATYVLDAPFEDNQLTTDPEMYAMMQAQVRAHPELALGSPSMRWLNEALRECRQLRRLPPPPLPMQTFLGSNERIVSAAAVEALAARWPGGRLERVPGAEHEIMMEQPATRARFFDAAADLFGAQA
ncbi:hydrolase [Defluviimonas sp. 20V17]|uniref:Hydrolase n=1 Tax=Allgaiera indica TaxID=765699 RepID=A0AAN4UQ48_9RHOB|nr:alpha/beta hydrolase [Allgaiera indica]KDB02959.1 hydrolase [Defluviimonas sp. 20V17]GHE00774.1 hydrolase [Allgaiera indica]SDW70297.1 lysophospholipase [Allgaiera indica]